MKNIIITLEKANIPEVMDVAESFEKEGFKIRRVFDYGVITGECGDKQFSDIKFNKKVLSVKENKEDK